MADDYTEVWSKVLLRASIDPAQAQSFVSDAFQQFAERREWSWLRKNSAFAPPQLYSTGLATATPGTANVTGIGTNWSQSMIGRQFRFGIYTPIYTVSAVDSATSLVLDQPWIGQAQISQGYLLYQAYYPTPTDFREWISLKDPQNNFRLHTNIQQSQLDFWDPQRSQNQTPRCASFLDYGGGLNGSQGTIGNVMTVTGAGGQPVSTTTFGYSYPGSATYVITILAGGQPGDSVLRFQWFRIVNSIPGSSAPIIQVTNNDPIDLSDGVQIYFPTGPVQYFTGEVFIVNCAQDATQPQSSPRYELWPHPMTQIYYYPFIYWAKIPDFDSAHPQLPPFVRRDVILELALEKAAMFPGVSVGAPNPYFSLVLAARHRSQYERMAMDLEIKDDSTATSDFMYQEQCPWAPMPFTDGSWLRDHAVPSSSW